MLCGENSGQLLLCGVQIWLKGSHNHFSMALTQKEVTEVALRWRGDPMLQSPGAGCNALWVDGLCVFG